MRFRKKSNRNLLCKPKGDTQETRGEREREREVDRRTDRQIYRQIDRQIYRQIDRERDRERERQEWQTRKYDGDHPDRQSGGNEKWLVEK